MSASRAGESSRKIHVSLLMISVRAEEGAREKPGAREALINAYSFRAPLVSGNNLRNAYQNEMKKDEPRVGAYGVYRQEDRLLSELTPRSSPPPS